MLLTVDTLLTGRELLRPGWIEVSHGSKGTVDGDGTGAPPRPVFDVINVRKLHAAGARQVLGSNGKCQNKSTIVTDPAQWPKKFGEAPALAELVKAGKLPPVEQRIPQEPMVLKPQMIK